MNSVTPGDSSQVQYERKAKSIPTPGTGESLLRRSNLNRLIGMSSFSPFLLKVS